MGAPRCGNAARRLHPRGGGQDCRRQLYAHLSCRRRLTLLAGGRTIIAIDETQAQPDKAALNAALVVLDHFMAALNAGDEPALLATLHFPHYRLAGGRMRVWD